MDREKRVVEMGAVVCCAMKLKTFCAARFAFGAQIEAGSKTVCGIGPGPDKLIDEVAGALKLL